MRTRYQLNEERFKEIKELTDKYVGTEHNKKISELIGCSPRLVQQVRLHTSFDSYKTAVHGKRVSKSRPRQVEADFDSFIQSITLLTDAMNVLSEKVLALEKVIVGMEKAYEDNSVKAATPYDVQKAVAS